MSKRTDEFLVSLSPGKTMDVCKDAIAELGWRVMEEDSDYISCKEVASQITSFTWPAKIDVYLEPSGDKTQIVFEGSIFGMGPIQSGHLQGQMGRFRNLIERSVKQAMRQSQNNNSPSLGIELERIAELHSKGLLTIDEFKIAKEKLLNK